MLAPVQRPPSTETSGWLAKLDLRYVKKADQTVLHHAHQGPLRVLKSLYPEQPSVCHNVLVHPPSGLIGSDRIDVQIHVEEGAHGLITTPGATRFLGRSSQWARQTVHMRLASRARLEWLPLETLVYNGAWASNRLVFELAPQSSLMCWDVYALGLAASHQTFEAGALEVQCEWPQRWQERALIQATDSVLLDGPLGLQGRRTLGQMVLAWDALAHLDSLHGLEAILDDSRALLTRLSDAPGTPQAPAWVWGLTASQPGLLQLRVLADHAHQIHTVFQSVWALWRAKAWDMPAVACRSWQL